MSGVRVFAGMEIPCGCRAVIQDSMAVVEGAPLYILAAQPNRVGSKIESRHCNLFCARTDQTSDERQVVQGCMQYTKENKHGYWNVGGQEGHSSSLPLSPWASADLMCHDRMAVSGD